MGGRGRGRGQSGTFTLEQLGLQKNEIMPGLVLKPPPTFPPLDSRPLPLSSGPSQDRLVNAKRSLRTIFRDSPFHIKADLRSSWLTEMLTKKKIVEKEVPDTMFPDNCWCYFPKELIPAKRGGGIKRKAIPQKKAADGKVKKTAAGEDILEKLSKLEDKDVDATKEDVENENEEGAGEEEDDESKEKKPPLNEEEEPMEDEDEEMDEGTDYANNYFDGGEDYVDDADDDGDDGPTF